MIARVHGFLVAVLLASSSGVALAGEADDLQRMVDVAKQGANDLERLDELRAAREDIVLIREWMDIAWKLRSEQKYDEVRVVLDRGQAQADMIRQKIIASKQSAEAARKESALQKQQSDIARAREELQAATLEKAALQGRSQVQ